LRTAFRGGRVASRIPRPPIAIATLDQRHPGSLQSTSSGGDSVTPLLNSYRVDNKSYPSDYFLLARFPKCGDALADADAHGRRALGGTAAAHLVQQRRDDPRARAAERVADGDRAAVHVDLLRVKLELVDAGDRLGRERLVEFDEVEV